MPSLTDDIAEKVSDMLFDIFIQGSNRFLDHMPSIARRAERLKNLTSKGLLHAIDYAKYQEELHKLYDSKGEVSASELSELRKKFKLDLRSLAVSDTDAQDYAKILKQKGVLFSDVNFEHKDYHLFTYPVEYTPEILEATKVLEAKRGLVTELPCDIYIDSLAPDHVSVMQGFDAEKLELFRHFAREEGMLFSVIPQDKDQNMVLFAREDKMKAENAMLKTGWVLTGMHGAEAKQQLHTRVRMREKLMECLRDPHKFLTVVSMKWPENRIEINDEGFTVFKGQNAIVNKSRTDADFEEELLRQVEGISDPALFTKEEYMVLDIKNRAEVKEKGRDKSMSLFTEHYDEMIDMNTLAEYRNIVTSKIVVEELEQDGKGEVTFGITDPGMKITDFAHSMYVTDPEELKARERELEHFKEAALFRRKEHGMADIDMRVKDIDYIIAQAETKLKNRTMEDPHLGKNREQSKTADEKRSSYDFEK